MQNTINCVLSNNGVNRCANFIKKTLRQAWYNFTYLPKPVQYPEEYFRHLGVLMARPDQELNAEKGSNGSEINSLAS